MRLSLKLPKFKLSGLKPPKVGALNLKGLARPRLTIGTKLVGLIALLLLTSIAGVGIISTTIMVQNDTSLIQVSNLNTAQVLASQMRETFVSATGKMRILGATLVQGTIAPEVKDRITTEFFSGDHDFLAMYVHTIDENGTAALLSSASSPELGKLGDTDGTKTLKAVTEDKGFQLGQLAKGEAQLTAIKLPDGTTPALVIGVHFASSDPIVPPRKVAPSPLLNSVAGVVGPVSPEQARAAAAATEAASRPKVVASSGYLLTAVIRQSRIAETFGKVDGASVFMVDRRGKLLAHGDASRVVAGENLSDLEIVKIMREGKSQNGEKRDYFDRPAPGRAPASGSAGEAQIGAYSLVGFAGLGVVAQVPAATAFEGTNQVKYESALVAGIILCLSFLAGFLYSGTITRPIKRLVEAAGRISLGDFKINLVAKGKDEVAHLSNAFNDMARGLEERDRVKETFNKFHNKEIAEKLLSGEVKLGGERKLATIFFSDIRSFTAMAESMQPEQVVELLNEYMTRMVKIIRSNGGVVDKYVGDAIMALWGVPIGGPSDALNAVKACLEMRMELQHLNAIRIQRGQPVLRIGMGLNTGEVIAGNIGSNEKMEYTVIGDTVNLGSRIESMTKEFGTDLLISKSVGERLGGHYLLETAGAAMVKGKSEPIEVFRVTGYIDEKGQPVRIETPYSSYTPDHSEKVQHVSASQPAPAPAPAPVTAQAPSPSPLQPSEPMAPTQELSMAAIEAMMLPQRSAPQPLAPAPVTASAIMETPLHSEQSMLIDVSQLRAAIAPPAPAPAVAPAPAPPAEAAPSILASAPLEALPLAAVPFEAPPVEAMPLAAAPAPVPVPFSEERVAPPIHEPIEVPLSEEASQIIQLNPGSLHDSPPTTKPDDQTTRFSQFMGNQAPEAALATPMPLPEAGIGELIINEDEKTGLLQTGAAAMESLIKAEEPTHSFALPTPEPAPDLTIESARVAMEKAYTVQTPEAASGPVLEIKEAPENLTIEMEGSPMPELFPAGLDSTWYVRVVSEVLGPFSSAEIRGGLERKEFTADSMMSSSPEGPWKRIDGFPQFTAAKAA